VRKECELAAINPRAIGDRADGWLPDWLLDSVRRFDTLSVTQRWTLTCLAMGMDIRTSARILGSSERTVKAHTSAVLLRLGVDSRLQAGLVGFYLMSSGELEPPEALLPKSISTNDHIVPADDGQ
jgi:hypothetical protein